MLASPRPSLERVDDLKAVSTLLSETPPAKLSMLADLPLREQRVTRHLQAVPDVPAAPRPRTRFSTVMDVARALGVGKSTVYRMIERGDLPAYKFGRNVVRIPTQAVWDYMHGSKIDPRDLSEAGPL